MKNILFILFGMICLGISSEASAQQKLSRAQINAKEAHLPHKRSFTKVKAEMLALQDKNRRVARENDEKYKRMKAEMNQRERSQGNRQ